MTTIPCTITSYNPIKVRPYSGKPIIPSERLGKVIAPVLVYKATKSGGTKQTNSDTASIPNKKDGIKPASGQAATGAMASPIAKGAWPKTSIEKRVLKHQSERQATKSVVEFLYNQAHDKLAQQCASKIERCGAFLEYTEYADGTSRLTEASFCGMNCLCPRCAKRRAWKLASHYAQVIQQVRGEHPMAKLYLVTLTVRPSKNLAGAVAHLARSTRTFLAHGKDSRRGKLAGWPEAANVIGAVQAIELCGDLSSSNSLPELWNPHSHGLWLCYRPPDIKHLRREWRVVTQDSYDVHVMPLLAYNLPAHAPSLETAIQFDTFRVLTYPQKFVELPVQVRWKIFSMFKNRNGRMPRLLSSHGVFYGRKKPPKDPLQKPHLVARYTLSGDEYDVLDAELLDDGE